MLNLNFSNVQGCMYIALTYTIEGPRDLSDNVLLNLDWFIQYIKSIIVIVQSWGSSL